MVGPDWVPASANSLVYNDRDPHPCDAVDRRQELDYWRRVTDRIGNRSRAGVVAAECCAHASPRLNACRVCRGDLGGNVRCVFANAE